MLKLGDNPYNFLNQISSLITGEDPNSGHITIQQEVLLHLEQMQIKDWKYIKELCQSFYHFCAISGNGFNQELGENLFRKLPGTLGREIETSWKELKGVQQDEITKNQESWSIGHRIKHIMKIIKRKCSEIQTKRQLKKSQYRICKNIFTPQTYGMEEDRKEKKYKPYRKYNKRYFLKRSIRRKPYLDPNRHVRKYNPKRIYTNKLKCYACGEPDHLSMNCSRKKNLYNTRSMLLDYTNEELVEIDEEISDTETIYSIVSIKEGKEYSDSENEDLINDLA